MSKPSPPYYHNKDRDAFHWETSCSKNYYPDPGWEKTNTQPAGKEQCNECKAK